MMQTLIKTNTYTSTSIDTCISENGISLNTLANGSSYLWSNDSTSSSITAADTGQYWVNTYDHCNNLIQSDTFTVEVCPTPPVDSCVSSTFKSPNVFTPNNDGVNEIFQIETPVCAQNILFEVYNRWGEKVHHHTSPIWNGKNNDKNCSEGTYFWTIQWTDRDKNILTHKGIITLLR